MKPLIFHLWADLHFFLSNLFTELQRYLGTICWDLLVSVSSKRDPYVSAFLVISKWDRYVRSNNRKCSRRRAWGRRTNVVPRAGWRVGWPTSQQLGGVSASKVRRCHGRRVRGGLGSEKAVPREQGRTNVAGEARMRAMHSDVKTQKTGT
jgi:hypothetical protein